MKKIMLVVALMIGMGMGGVNNILAFEAYIPSDSDNFQYGACNNKGFQCTSNSVTDSVVPVVTTGLCDSGWTPVCFYGSDGTYDVNVGNCSCRKLQSEESDPVTHTNNACVCSGSQVTINECNDGMKATCTTNSSTTSDGYSTCRCMDAATSANEESVTGHSYQIGESIVSTTYTYNPICNGNGISTAFGCIPYDASGFAAKFLQILFGVAGGIAFLLMVYGFILVATSSGDEKKLQGAKETVTSAITGLLISIFALLLFRLIAVNILQIPGLS